jgi:hypothetical protein
MVDVDVYVLVNFQQTGEKRGRETGFFGKKKKIHSFFSRIYPIPAFSKICTKEKAGARVFASTR